MRRHFFFLALRLLLFFFWTASSTPTITMSDVKPERVSKRKSRDGPEEAPRKKQHRSDEVQFEDYGKGGDNVPAKSTRKYKDKFAPRPERQYPSVNDLKKRIRDVKRLLQKPNLPADARILQERALAGYEQDLADENVRRERSQIISKYHFVRFLGKLTKLLLCQSLLLIYLCDQTGRLQTSN